MDPCDRPDGSGMSTPARWAPHLAEFRADPYPFYAALREADPVHRVDDWSVVLTRYDDVHRVLRDPGYSRDIESSSARPVDDDPITARRRQRRGTDEEANAAKSILNLDPPDHTRLRRLVTQAFTPRAIDRLRAATETMVDDILDTAAERGSMELIDELAFPVPFRVISTMLDMPMDRADDMRDWSQALTATLEPTATLDDFDAADAAIEQLIPHLVEVIEHRRHNLGDDVVSALITAEEEGDRLSLPELISFVVLLYVAGHETTVNLIGNGMLALLENPDEMQRWRSDPALDKVAVDELLRFNGPVQQTVRVPMTPVTFAGTDGTEIHVDAGQAVITCLGAANHDPAVFANPARVQLDRPNAHRHMSFASGIHYCLGASLAKMEATVALSRIIRRFDTIEQAEPASWRDRLTIRGVDRLVMNLE
jgi:cytochrome P450